MDYLLDEGYADTPEYAVSILENMSDDMLLELINEAEGSYGQTPKATSRYLALSKKRRSSGSGTVSPASDVAYSHFSRSMDPDAGDSNRKSSNPSGLTLRRGMTSDIRTDARKRSAQGRMGHGVYTYPGYNELKGSTPKGKKLERQRKRGVSA